MVWSLVELPLVLNVVSIEDVVWEEATVEPTKEQVSGFVEVNVALKSQDCEVIGA